MPLDKSTPPGRLRPPRDTAQPAAPSDLKMLNGSVPPASASKRRAVPATGGRDAGNGPRSANRRSEKNGGPGNVYAPYKLIGALTVTAAVLVIVIIALFTVGSSNAAPMFADEDGPSAPGNGSEADTKIITEAEITEGVAGVPLGGDINVVCVDPGHGYDDPGAIYEPTMGDIPEKDITLDISLRITELLRFAGLTVIMTRADDEIPADYDSRDQYTLDPFERVDFVAAHPEIDLFVSLHCDAFTEDTSVGGARVYTYTEGVEGTVEYAGALSASLGKVLSQSVPIIAKNMAEAYYVTKMLPIPSILIELGFITNAVDAVNLQSNEWLDNFAAGAAQGILDYIGSRG